MVQGCFEVIDVGERSVQNLTKAAPRRSRRTDTVLIPLCFSKRISFVFSVFFDTTPERCGLLFPIEIRVKSMSVSPWGCRGRGFESRQPDM